MFIKLNQVLLNYTTRDLISKIFTKNPTRYKFQKSNPKTHFLFFLLFSSLLFLSLSPPSPLRPTNLQPSPITLLPFCPSFDAIQPPFDHSSNICPLSLSYTLLISFASRPHQELNIIITTSDHRDLHAKPPSCGYHLQPLSTLFSSENSCRTSQTTLWLQALPQSFTLSRVDHCSSLFQSSVNACKTIYRQPPS